MARISTKLSKERFQGCLAGAVIGDCFGAPFEGKLTSTGIERKEIFHKLNLDNKNGEFSIENNKSKKQLKFTDDSAMTFSVGKSLLEHNSLDSVDMASRFCEEFYKARNRGYGGGVIQIFKNWNLNGITKDNVFEPSKNQFSGSGSYGNGAAMRVSPVGLFAKTEEDCIKFAKETAVLTHSHKCGYNGAILQALAVFKALHIDKDIDYSTYISELQGQISKLEGCDVPDDFEEFEKFKRDRVDQMGREDILFDWTRSDSFTFTYQLGVLKELLAKEKKDPSENSIPTLLENIGSDISSMQAVPAAIYCFLKNTKRGFQETVFTAISLGSDTDTVASMACSIAGAYHGLSNIPSSWIQSCEGVDEVIELGARFYDLSIINS